MLYTILTILCELSTCYELHKGTFYQRSYAVMMMFKRHPDFYS